MKKLYFSVALAATVVALPVLAHNWSCWSQPDRNVTYKNSGGSQAAAAINEWNADTILNLSSSNNAEIEVSSSNYGNTGWGGLATITQYSGCTILHGTAVLNTYYSYTSNGQRGVFCQEVGHLFGLDHSNDGGCMGGGYYYSIDNNYNVVSHNISDISKKYRRKHGEAEGGHDDDAPKGPIAHGVWFNNPTTLGDVTDLSSSIVIARVTGVFDGDALVGVDGVAIPTQAVAFEVSRTLKGEVASAFDLFHTGNDNFTLIGDPAYAIGESYVLFMNEREDGSYVLVSPEGRYEIQGKSLRAVSDKEFALKIEELGLGDLLMDLRERGHQAR